MELKPCKCGGTPRFSCWYGAVTVVCPKCGAKSKSRGIRKDGVDNRYQIVTEDWNLRFGKDGA